MSDPKWKRAERRFASILQRAAGEVRDPVLGKLVTSTGRVGHLTELGFDLLAGNPEDGTALVGEVKRRKVFLSAVALKAVQQIVRIASEYKRFPLIGITLPDKVPIFVETKDGSARIERDWVLLPLSVIAELLHYRRLASELARAYPDIVARAQHQLKENEE